MFSIALHFYPIWFGKCCRPFTYMPGSGETLNLKIKPLVLGSLYSSLFLSHGPIKLALSKKPKFWTWKSPHLCMKVVCFVVIRSTELGCFRLCFWCLWKALHEKGCMGLVPWGLDLQCKKSWILNDFFIAEYFGGIGMYLWCCWKDFDEQDWIEFIW
jgi:hypothetical protein